MGGGVYVVPSGYSHPIFTMTGGEISGNAAHSNAGKGGGVYVGGGGGTFRLVTGTIYGSSETVVSNRNTASSGAALSASDADAIAQYGTLNGNTWNRVGDLTTTNVTIRVVGGVLDP
jgi:hypothetical protein